MTAGTTTPSGVAGLLLDDTADRLSDLARRGGSGVRACFLREALAVQFAVGGDRPGVQGNDAGGDQAAGVEELGAEGRGGDEPGGAAHQDTGEGGGDGRRQVVWRSPGRARCPARRRSGGKERPDCMAYSNVAFAWFLRALPICIPPGFDCATYSSLIASISRPFGSCSDFTRDSPPSRSARASAAGSGCSP